MEEPRTRKPIIPGGSANGILDLFQAFRRHLLEVRLDLGTGTEIAHHRNARAAIRPGAGPDDLLEGFVDGVAAMTFRLGTRQPAVDGRLGDVHRLGELLLGPSVGAADGADLVGNGHVRILTASQKIRLRINQVRCIRLRIYFESHPMARNMQMTSRPEKARRLSAGEKTQVRARKAVGHDFALTRDAHGRERLVAGTAESKRRYDPGSGGKAVRVRKMRSARGDSLARAGAAAGRRDLP